MKIKTILFMTFLPINCMAYDIEVDGIFYNVNETKQELSVTNSGDKYASKWDYSLEKYIIPEEVYYKGLYYKVTSIDEEAFFDCQNITEIVIPQTVETIGRCAFWRCLGIKKLELKEGLVSIGQYAFEYCRGLKKITLPESLEVINDGAFDDCRSLETIFIPKGVLFIDGNVFTKCESLSSINVDKSNKRYLSEDGLLYSKDKTKIISCPINKNVGLQIPEEVITIGKYAFYNSKISSVIFSKNIETIEERAFGGCNILKSLYFPNSNTNFGDYSFSSCEKLENVIFDSGSSTNNNIKSFRFLQNCKSLTNIILPKDVRIDNLNFEGCESLKKIILPANIRSISTDCFKNCYRLRTIVSEITSPDLVYVYDGSFKGITNLATLYVPKGLTETYKRLPYWKDFVDIAEVDNFDENDVYLVVMSKKGGLTNIENININCGTEIISLKKNTNKEIIFFPDEGKSKIKILFNDKNISSKIIDNRLTIEITDNSKLEIFYYSEDEIEEDDDNITPDTPKCATPEISYVNGKISLSCKTKDVEYVSEVTVSDAKKYYGSEFTLSQIYKISVYATKDGYENSDTVTAEFTANGKLGDLNGDGKINVADHVKLSDIIMNQ